MVENATIESSEILSKETWSYEDHVTFLGTMFSVKDAPSKCCELVAELENTRGDQDKVALLKTGMVYYSLGRFQQCLDALKAAGQTGDSCFVTGLCLMAMKQYTKAVEAFELATAKGFDSTKASVKTIESLLMNGQKDDAAKILQSIGKTLEGTADELYLRGLVDELDGNKEDAIAAYTEARKIQGHHAEATFRLAYLIDLYGEEEEALELYRKCLENPPVYTSVLLNMAIIYEDAGKYKEAIACLKRVLACNPNHWRANLFLQDAIASTDMFYDEDRARRIAKRNALLDINVTDFELSVRARNCLKKMNIFTLGDLVRTTEAELLTYKNFGETSLREIKEMLAIKGLSLGQALDENDPLFGNAVDIDGESSEEAEVGVRAIPIDKLELSIRSHRVLENLNISTLGQLADKTEAELTCQKNFGKTSLVEIREVLAQHDLALRSVK